MPGNAFVSPESSACVHNWRWPSGDRPVNTSSRPSGDSYRVRQAPVERQVGWRIEYQMHRAGREATNCGSDGPEHPTRSCQGDREDGGRDPTQRLRQAYRCRSRPASPHRPRRRFRSSQSRRALRRCRAAAFSHRARGIARAIVRRRGGVSGGSCFQSISWRSTAARTSDSVLAAERALAGEHLVEDDAEGPDVGALVDRLAPRLFRRHVRGSAEDHPHLRRTGRSSVRRLIGRPPRRRSDPSPWRARNPAP